MYVPILTVSTENNLNTYPELLYLGQGQSHEDVSSTESVLGYHYFPYNPPDQSKAWLVTGRQMGSG